MRLRPAGTFPRVQAYARVPPATLAVLFTCLPFRLLRPMKSSLTLLCKPSRCDPRPHQCPGLPCNLLRRLAAPRSLLPCLASWQTSNVLSMKLELPKLPRIHSAWDAIVVPAAVRSERLLQPHPQCASALIQHESDTDTDFFSGTGQCWRLAARRWSLAALAPTHAGRRGHHRWPSASRRDR